MTQLCPPSLAISLAVAALCAAAAPAQAAAPGNMISILEAMQGNTWQALNHNSFLDAALPEAMRASTGNPPSTGNPGSVIYAWSSFAWDSQRSELLIFGGGHANYPGNEIYKWSAASQNWGLASLPSRVVAIPAFNAEANFAPVDGAMNAPTSAHTYDNNNYLPVADRMLVMGGAAFNSGGSFTLQVDANTSRFTGPYLFDPNRADPSKVGGTDGSGVNPATLGGRMWQNRDLVAQGVSGLQFIEGTSAVAKENGKDAVYFSARSNGAIFTDLYRLRINEVATPASDTLEKVGVYFNPAVNPSEAPIALGSAGYDPTSKLYVAVGGGNQPFVAWDMDTAPQDNAAFGIAPTVVGGSFVWAPSMGVEFDPVRGVWLVWGGGGTVWALAAPAAGTIAGQWTLTKIADGGTFAQGAAPLPVQTTGVRGKWHYAVDLDAFIALEDSDQGNVWVYKPTGWVNPTAVPEPANWGLMLAGLLLVAGIVGVRRRNADAGHA